MTYKTAQLVAVLQGAHNPALAKQPGMVYQVWEDGEITLQKSGELLWQRSLHSIVPGLRVKVPPTLMPEQSGKAHEMHGYAFVTEDDAKIIRDMIENLEDRPEWNPPPKPVNEGPLVITTSGDQATAERVRSYLVREFPMARDGKIEAHLPTEGYWVGKGVWEIRFPSGHDHWAGYKNTLEKIQAAAGDYRKGYDEGYKQGQIDEAHAAVLKLSKRELKDLQMRTANPHDILDEIRGRETFDIQFDTRATRLRLTKKNIKATHKEILEVVREHASRGWIRIVGE